MRKNILIKVLLIIICVVTIFHLCVVAKIIPYDIAWGGQLQNDTEMYVFEFLSIFINLFLGFVLLMKNGTIQKYFKQRVINFILWIYFALFTINTVGNLFAKTNFEKSFSILTLIFAILIWAILKGGKRDLDAKNES